MANKLLKKEIGKYDINNKLIETYAGIGVACDKTNLPPTTLNRYINNGRVLNGFYYQYTGRMVEGDFCSASNKQNVLFDQKDIDIRIASKNFKPEAWEWRECPICGKRFFARKSYKKVTCSESCYKEYVNINKEKINEVRSISCKKAFHSKTKEEIDKEHAKAKATCLEKYGVDMYQKTAEYKKAMSDRFKNKDWSERSRKVTEALIPKYKEICDNDNLELVEFRNRFDCTVKCKKCGNVFDVHVLGYLTDYSTNSLCRRCHPNNVPTTYTKPFIFIENVLNEAKIDYHENDRTVLYPYEIDFVIPSRKIGIEVNGNYWHSEISGNKPKDYHIKKTIGAKKKGFKLIHIFEDEIISKPDIVKSRILNLIGKTPSRIYARECIIKELDSNTKKKFLNENHIDGDSVSKYNIGLFHNKELVCVGTFGTRKISGTSSFELIRFSNRINTTVVGGFSKIFKYFVKNYKPSTITTYADIRWSGLSPEDNVYVKSGFIYNGCTQPNYFYVDKVKYLKRINRLNFTKQKLIKMGYDENKTEAQIMIENGYDRIWDCGSMRFTFSS